MSDSGRDKLLDSPSPGGGSCDSAARRDSLSTRQSMLDGMRRTLTDPAWDSFYRMYAGVILRFARACGLPESNAQDVLQATMMVLMKRMSGFDYAPERGKFRSFLFAIVRNKAREERRRLARRQAREIPLDAAPDHGDGDGRSLADKLPDTKARGAEALEWTRWVDSNVREALARVREQVAPHRFDVFYELVFEGRAVDEVAARHRLSRNTVYKIKHDLLLRLRPVVEELLAEERV